MAAGLTSDSKHTHHLVSSPIQRGPKSGKGEIYTEEISRDSAGLSSGTGNASVHEITL